MALYRLWENKRGIKMFTWKQKVLKKRKKGNRTPGRAKAANCQTTPLDGHMAKASRSYKHPQYGAWLQKMAKRREKYGG